MNVLKVVKIKKPLKSYDFKGFNSICFSARGERGICILFTMPLFKRVFNSYKMSAPNCAPLNLTIFITCINRLKFSKNSTNNQLKGSKFSIVSSEYYPTINGSTCSYFKLVYWQNSSMLKSSFWLLLRSTLIFCNILMLWR